ncbi:MAG: hypothetical protein NVSMB32_07730 [Actinomycetota bacterium]
MRRRVVRTTAAAALVAFLAATVLLFVRPIRRGPAHHADAVVVLSGGRGERLTLGLELMRQGVAGVLVASEGLAEAWPAAQQPCQDTASYRVLCPSPTLNSTRGEAEMIGGLATRYGWHTIVVVTSRYHVVRARLLARRCFRGTLTTVASSPHATLVAHAGFITHEWLGLAYALAIQRSC